MSRRSTADTPTDEEILSYNNVPVDVAAKYIGWSSCNVAYALQQERAPFGMAADTGGRTMSGLPTYTYNISPGLLVKYKRGGLQAWRLNEVLKLAADGYQKVIDARLGAADGSSDLCNRSGIARPVDTERTGLKKEFGYEGNNGA